MTSISIIYQSVRVRSYIYGPARTDEYKNEQNDKIHHDDNDDNNNDDDCNYDGNDDDVYLRWLISVKNLKRGKLL
jgi:hypothetical protein